MSVEFRAVYESDGRLPVVLETAAMLAPNGTRYTHHRLSVSDGRPGVVVIARNGDRVMLVLSDRRATGRSIWEFPRGSSEPEDFGNAGESLDKVLRCAAERELREETGFHTKASQVIGRFIVDSSIFPREVGVAVCEVDVDAPRGKSDGEILSWKWVSVDALGGLIQSGELCDALTLAAWALWLSERRGPGEE